MRFEFANPVVSLLFGKAFEQSCGTLIDAFIVRARQLHGAPEFAGIEVAYALPGRQRVVRAAGCDGMTALEAVRASGLLEEFPELAGQALASASTAAGAPASRPAGRRPGRDLPAAQAIRATRAAGLPAERGRRRSRPSTQD